MEQARRKTIEEDTKIAELGQFSKFGTFAPLNQLKLQEIVYKNQTYLDLIHNYLKIAITKMHIDQYSSALLQLAEAEKMLQYGASCGRIINQNLILSVLHNQACCFQRSGQLTKAQKYIEAVIFNLQSHLVSQENSPAVTPTTYLSPTDLNSSRQEIAPENGLQLTDYHLQLCSLNSQMKLRNEALQSASKAVQTFKRFFSQAKKNWHKFSGCKNATIEEKTRIAKAIQQIKITNQQFSINRLDQQIRTARRVAKKWISKTKNGERSGLDKHFSEYSIGHLVELIPKSLEEEERQKSKDGQLIVQKLVHWGMAYFQIATEYRLMAEQAHPFNSDDKEASENFKLSQVYHLNSIIHLSLHVPFNLLFMHQIIDSYDFHYRANLLQDQSPASSDTVLMFHPEEEKSENNNDCLSEKKKLALTLKERKSAEKLLKHKRKFSLTKFSARGQDEESHVADEYFQKKDEIITKRKKRITSTNTEKSDKSSGKRRTPQLKKNITQSNFLPSEEVFQTHRRKRIMSSYSKQNQAERLHAKSTNLREEFDEYGGINFEERGEMTKRSSRVNSLRSKPNIGSNRKTSVQGKLAKSPHYSRQKLQKKELIKEIRPKIPKARPQKKVEPKKAPKPKKIPKK